MLWANAGWALIYIVIIIDFRWPIWKWQTQMSQQQQQHYFSKWLSKSQFYYYYYWLLLYSAILCSQADSLRLHVILHEWIAFYSMFLNIHWSGVFTALAWLVPQESAARESQSQCVLCTPYNHAPWFLVLFVFYYHNNNSKKPVLVIDFSDA